MVLVGKSQGSTPIDRESMPGTPKAVPCPSEEPGGLLVGLGSRPHQGNWSELLSCFGSSELPLEISLILQKVGLQYGITFPAVPAEEREGDEDGPSGGGGEIRFPPPLLSKEGPSRSGGMRSLDSAPEHVQKAFWQWILSSPCFGVRLDLVCWCNWTESKGGRVMPQGLPTEPLAAVVATI